MNELSNQKAFLSKVAPVLRTEWAELAAHLQKAQWLQAKNKAHQLKGIFYLLESKPLLDSLCQIEEVSLPLIATPEFTQRLEQQVDDFCLDIEQYVAQ